MHPSCVTGDMAKLDEVRSAIEDVNRRIDCRELLPRLVAGWTPKERTQAKTLHGVCPKCGGRDRFYVTIEGAACPHCHDRKMDAVGLVAWLRGCTMAEAVRELDAGALRAVLTVTATPHERSQAAQSDDWRSQAQQAIADSSRRLYTDAGAPGRQYLLSRGLQPDTWRAFELGFVTRRSLTSNREDGAPAIVWPVYHESTGAIMAVRYRYIGATSTGDRYDSLKGSSTVDRLFGTQAAFSLTPPEDARPLGSDDPTQGRVSAEALRCLVVCEGEFNAMSIWQACNMAGVDAFSFGSESQRRLPAWLVDLASCYGAILVWVDTPDKAREVQAQLGARCVALRSVYQDGAKLDANALLVAGSLGGLIQAARLSVARGRLRESILWQLWDVKADLDAGSVTVAQRLAHELGRTWDGE